MDMPTSWGEVAALAAAAGAGALAAVQRIVKAVGATRLQHATDGAQLDIVGGLRTEVSRLADQNGKLVAIVNTLQLEVIQLREENSELRGTVNELRDEMQRLQAPPVSGFPPLQEYPRDR